MRAADSKRFLPALSLAICCATLGGCSAKSNRGTVTGNVTLDGQPLKSGLIRFEPADGKTPTADALITDGKFSASVPPGDKKISISATKVVGTKRVYETPDSPTVDVTQELLPAKYNVKSELTLSVKAGSQEKDFALTSGK
jgi:hypothetical protein